MDWRTSLLYSAVAGPWLASEIRQSAASILVPSPSGYRRLLRPTVPEAFGWRSANGASFRLDFAPLDEPVPYRCAAGNATATMATARQPRYRIPSRGGGRHGKAAPNMIRCA